MYANMTHAIGGAGIGLLVASTRKGRVEGLDVKPFHPLLTFSRGC